MASYHVELITRGVPVRSPTHGAVGWCTVGLAMGGESVIIIDTGGFPYRELLSERLAALSLAPRDVTDVLVTHAHWDHVSNAALFPEARVWIAAAELEWALALPDGDLLVPAALVRALVEAGRVEAFSADGVPLDGIVTIPTPGHTPGHTSYGVPTQEGLIVFTGDAAKNEAELRTGVVQSTLDPRRSRAALNRLAMLSEEGAILACGHDRPLRHDADAGYVALADHPAALSIIEPDGGARVVEAL
jgi:glyoxylase-like metal-dependent hydrolase (beta-lactamase superfamily II)